MCLLRSVTSFLIVGLLLVQTGVHCDNLKSLFVLVRHGMREFATIFVQKTAFLIFFL